MPCGAADTQVSPVKVRSSVKGSTSAGKGRDKSTTNINQLNTIHCRAQHALLCHRVGPSERGGAGKQARPSISTFQVVINCSSNGLPARMLIEGRLLSCGQFFEGHFTGLDPKCGGDKSPLSRAQLGIPPGNEGRALYISTSTLRGVGRPVP